MPYITPVLQLSIRIVKFNEQERQRANASSISGELDGADKRVTMFKMCAMALRFRLSRTDLRFLRPPARLSAAPKVRTEWMCRKRVSPSLLLGTGFKIASSNPSRSKSFPKRAGVFSQPQIATTGGTGVPCIFFF